MSIATPCYSPSQTREFQVCPMKWAIGRKWKPRTDDTEAREIGIALHVGVLQAFQQSSQGVLDIGTCVQKGLDEIPVSSDDVRHLAERAIKVGAKEIPSVLRGGRVLIADEDVGGGRPDLVIEWPDKNIIVVDVKYSRQLPPDRVHYRVEAQETDPQLWDYAWRVGQYLGRSVHYVGFYFVTTSPRNFAHFDPIAIDQQRVATWLSDAEKHWEQMFSIENGNEAPAGRWTACLSRDENYGQCRFYTACHTLHRDESLYPGLYEPVERLPGYTR